jgi:hypothetical protein
MAFQCPRIWTVSRIPMHYWAFAALDASAGLYQHWLLAMAEVPPGFPLTLPALMFTSSYALPPPSFLLVPGDTLLQPLPFVLLHRPSPRSNPILPFYHPRCLPHIPRALFPCNCHSVVKSYHISTTIQSSQRLLVVFLVAANFRSFCNLVSNVYLSTADSSDNYRSKVSQAMLCAEYGTACVSAFFGGPLLV